MPKALIVSIFADTRQFTTSLDRAVGKTRRFGKAAGVAGTAIAVGLAVGLEKSVKAASAFQSSMELVETQAGGSAKEVKTMSAALLGLAGDVGATPEELAAGLYHVESAGFRGAKALSILRLAAEGAAVGHSDLESTTTALVAAQRSGIKGLGSMGHAMGSLNAIVGAGNMRMEDLTSALGTGILPTAKAFGASISDVGAALATMTSNGVPAVNAASGLKMMLASLAAPTDKAKKSLHSIGMGASQLAKTVRRDGLQAALQELKDHMDKAGLSATQSAALLSGAFGKRSSTGILTLLGNLKQMKAAQGQIEEGASTFGDTWATTQKSAEFATKKLHATVSALQVGIGAGLLPAVTAIVQKLASFVAVLVKHKTAAKILVIGLVALAATLITVSIASKIATAASKLGTAAQYLYKLALGRTAMQAKLMAAAQWLLNAAMSANPVVLIIAALVALGVVFVVLWKKSETFRRIVLGVWDAIKSAFWAAVGWIKKVWESIKGAFGSAIDWVQGHWKIFLGLPGLIWQYWGPITDAFARIWGGIKGAFGAAIGWIKSTLSTAWKWIETKALQAVLLIVEPFSHLPGFMGGWARDIKTAVQEKLDKISGDKAKKNIEGITDSVLGLSGALGKLDGSTTTFSVYGHGTINAGGVGPNGATGSTGADPKPPGAATGGWVSRTGLAVIHRGEWFSGVGSHAMARTPTGAGGGGGGSSMVAEVPIHISLADGRIIRELRHALLREGRRGTGLGAPGEVT